MHDAPLIAHSLAEVYLFLMATPCPSCGKGPLRGGEPSATPCQGKGPSEETGTGLLESTHVCVPTDCTACHAMALWTFQLASLLPAPDGNQPPVINATGNPSRILDVAQWIMLFRMISTSAAEQSDKQAGRRLSMEAGGCLDEALKFYEPDNDLPPASAFFHEGSRDRLRKHPEQFSRTRLLGLRAKLPTHNARHYPR